MGITDCPVCHADLVVITTTTTHLVDPLLTLNALGVWQVQMASARVLTSALDVRCINHHTDDEIKKHLRNRTLGA